MNKFYPIFIKATSLNDCWHQLLYQLYKNGRKYNISSGSFMGHNRIAFDFVSGFISHPHDRPIAPVMPDGCSLPPPTTDNDIDFYFSDYLMNPSLSKNEHYKYSSWIVGKNKICKTNQVAWIINHFKTNGYGNEHCTIMVGNSNSCLSYDTKYMKCPQCQTIYTINKQAICTKCFRDKEDVIQLEVDETLRGSTPCLRLLDFRIINGYLTTNVVYRSWSLYSGFPTNMGGFILLNEYIADQLHGVEPGPLSFSCKSLHCYDFEIEFIRQRLGK